MQVIEVDEFVGLCLATDTAGGWYIYAVLPPHDPRFLRVIRMVLLTLTLLLRSSDDWAGMLALR